MSYIKCGLCTFHIRGIQPGKGTLTDQQLLNAYITHYVNVHNPKHRCHYCHKAFYIENVLTLHAPHCRKAIELNAIAAPSEKADIYYYMKTRCGYHKVDFTDEFLYADHMTTHHIHEVDGGEMAHLLGLSIKDVLHEYNSRLGIQYVCHMCGKQDGLFDTPAAWMEHVHNTHPGRVTCDVCCQFVGSIKMHSKHAHGTHGESYFICLVKECKYRGAGFPSLFQHTTNTHPEINMQIPREIQRKCNDCEFTIEYEFDKKLSDYSRITRKMWQHYATEHDKRFCERCGNFYSRKHIDAHIETHLAEETGERKHKCTVCDLMFVHRDSLRDHFKRHDEKNRSTMCHLCSKSFFTKRDLNSHIRSVHREKDIQCDTCDHMFSSTKRMNNHKKRCGNPHYVYTKQKRGGGSGGSGQVLTPESEARRARKRAHWSSSQDTPPTITPTGHNQQDVHYTKVHYNDDMRLSVLTPVTSSDLTAHAHTSTAHLPSSVSTSMHGRVLEHHHPQHHTTTHHHEAAAAAAQNMTIGQLGLSSLGSYYQPTADQQHQQGVTAYDEVYRATNSLGMMIPGFGLTAGQMNYAAPQPPSNHQQN